MCSKRSDRFFDLFDPPKDDVPLSDTRFKRPGQQTTSLQDFHRSIDYTIDFHGHTIAEALKIIEEHLQAHRMSHICLLIHGKGLHGQSILKRHILHYLKQNTRCYGYTQAPAHKGGHGATVVRFAKHS